MPREYNLDLELEYSPGIPTAAHDYHFCDKSDSQLNTVIWDAPGERVYPRES